MDPLTHALAGAAVCDALPFSRPVRAGSRGFAMFMAMSPDFDLVPAFIAGLPGNLIPGNRLFDPYWTWLHRTYTHSVMAIVVLGIVGGFLAWRFGGREQRVWRWMFLGMAALASHVVLDLVTRGVAAFAPFMMAWKRWGDLPTVDPLTLIPFAVCFLFCHRFDFGAWRRFSTLNAAQSLSEWIYAKYGQRLSSTCIARICLVVAAVGIFVRIVFLGMS